MTKKKIELELDTKEDLTIRESSWLVDKSYTTVRYSLEKGLKATKKNGRTVIKRKDLLEFFGGKEK